jgi:hypothetical protein
MAELVKVELIANPAVTRLMTPASFRNNQNKWRIQGATQEVQQPQKKSVEPVVASFVSVSQSDGPTEFIDPTAPVTSNGPEPTGLLAGLQAQYKAKAGKDADKRWGVKKLTEEINKPTEV